MRDLAQITTEIYRLTQALEGALAELRADTAGLSKATEIQLAADTTTAALEETMHNIELRAHELTLSLRLLAVRASELNALAQAQEPGLN